MGITKVTINVPPESIFTEEQLKNGGPFCFRGRGLLPGETILPDIAEYAKHRDFWREDAHEIVDILFDLRDKHDPRLGTSSAVGKDDDVEWALGLINCLGTAGAGWALNHKAGRAIDPTGERDSHRHEEIGRQVQAIDLLDDPKKFRPALAALIASLALFFPRTTASHLQMAILALNSGELSPLLTPLKSGEHGQAFTLWLLRLCAVSYWRFLVVQGRPKSKSAVKRIAEAYGCSEITVRSWAPEVWKHLEEPTVEQALGAAERAGRLAHKFPAKLGDPTLLESDYFAHAQYTEDALRRAAKTYQAVLRTGKQKEGRRDRSGR